MPQGSSLDNVIPFRPRRPATLARDLRPSLGIAGSRRRDLAVVAFLALLALGCARLTQALVHESALEDCLLSGRPNCVDVVLR
jgi:hypothetical protein